MCPERKHIQGEQWVKTHGVQGDFHSKGDGSAMLLKRKKKVNEVREKPPPLGVLWENPGSPSQGGSSVSALAAPHAWTQRGPPFLTLPPPPQGKAGFASSLVLACIWGRLGLGSVHPPLAETKPIVPPGQGPSRLLRDRQLCIWPSPEAAKAFPVSGPGGLPAPPQPRRSLVASERRRIRVPFSAAADQHLHACATRGCTWVKPALGLRSQVLCAVTSARTRHLRTLRMCWLLSCISFPGLLGFAEGKRGPASHPSVVRLVSSAVD